MALALAASTAEAIRPLEEVERVGTQTEMLPAATVVDELSGIHFEHQANDVDDAGTKVTLFKSASDSYLKIRNQEPQFVARFDMDGPTDSFTKRGFYCLALSEFHAAKSILSEFPTQALDNLHKSVTLFKQAQSADDEQRVQVYIGDIQLKRHCWCCGREMQGNGLFYKYYPAKLEKYHRHLITELQQDAGMVERDGHVTLCTVCGSAMEIQADAYATLRSGEVRDWAKDIFDSHASAIDRLNTAVQELSDRINRINTSR